MPDLPKKTDVLIIGGGVVGAACACELARRGVSLTLIEKGQIGHGCSYGNGGWITPSHAVPLAMPGMFLKSIKWLMDPESPLYIQPRASWELFRWLGRFALSMNHKHLRRSVAALTALANYSLDAYRKLEAERPGTFGFTARGMVIVAQKQSGLDAAHQAGSLVREHGIASEVLDPDQVKELEPAVAGADLIGGIYFPDEAHAEPLETVRILTRCASDHGATILPQTEAFDFERTNNRITAVRTTRGWISADQVVLATGSWSDRLGRSLGIRVPVLAGKGYAITVEPFEPAPTRPIMLIENKVVVTPRADSCRLAGTVELVDHDNSITKRRVDAVIRGCRLFLNIPDPPKVREIWRGLRPCTPDGVPIIGRSRRIENLVVSTGHQMIGLLSAPGTARLVADLVTGAEPIFDPHPFRIERF